MLICVATFLIVRHLRFHKIHFQSTLIERRLIRYIWIIVVITIIPSIYLAYKIVERSIFESNAKNFVQSEFKLSKTQVVSKTFKVERSGNSIELLLVGREIPTEQLDSITRKLPQYDLKGTKLVIHQGLDANKEIDIAQIRASILENAFEDDKQLDTFVVVPKKLDLPIPDIRNELSSLYPELQDYIVPIDFISS